MAHRPARGPSPRAWGSASGAGVRGRVGRSIPTCVGLSRVCSSRCRASPVHPHVRGAQVTRGVPAAWTAVHPHVRGAQIVIGGAATMLLGPSPRAWGSADLYWRPIYPQRSIPTCVGLRRCTEGVEWWITVHPHVRGAQIVPCWGTRWSAGPSPRAWGSGRCIVVVPRRSRSIPTCVGLRENDLRKQRPLSSRNLRLAMASAPHSSLPQPHRADQNSPTPHRLQPSPRAREAVLLTWRPTSGKQPFLPLPQRQARPTSFDLSTRVPQRSAWTLRPNILCLGQRPPTTLPRTARGQGRSAGPDEKVALAHWLGYGADPLRVLEERGTRRQMIQGRTRGSMRPERVALEWGCPRVTRGHPFY